MIPAIRQIHALIDECADAGWDSVDAEPLSKVAAEQAANFIRALPADVPPPELAPDPDGSISLDWIESRHHLFSLSVGITDRLPFAWLDGTDHGHGVARFDGATIPPRLLGGIRAIVNGGNAPRQTA